MKDLIIFSVCMGLIAMLNIYRMIKGPTAADRMVAADCTDILISLAMMLFSLYSGRGIYLDIAIITAMLGIINTMLVGSDVMLAMLKLDEFQNPLTGLNFQGTGTLTTPLGAKLLRTSAMPAGILIGLDKNYALEQICGSEVTVEYDKLIDRQLERAAITSISGFAKLFTDAAKVLKLK